MLASLVMSSNVCVNLRNWYRLSRNINTKLLSSHVGINSARSFSLGHRLCRKIFRSPVKYTKHQNVEVKDVGVESNQINSGDLDSLDEEEGAAELQHLIDKTLHIHELGHQVFIIQPYVKWGPQKKKLTSPELQLDEAVALIKTLRNWKVVDKTLVSLTEMNKPTLFGSGQLNDLRNKILSNSKITAVFVAVNMLKALQQEHLQEAFGVPVYDRYTIVIHIFRSHATTKEAKLQIKLAEIPYLWSRVKGIGRGSLANFGGGSSAIGTIWKGKEFHLLLLKERQAKVKEQIAKLRQHRQNVRKTRIKKEIPIIAVVGYTNSGKTSLIKALTGRKKLQPQNYLFATLDVTVHEGYLPSSAKVLYVDTIGFISDIPTTLFESFVTTLEDARMADVLIHVRDISHPDNVAQNQNVLETLQLLQLPEKLSENMITVGNKIDLLSNEELNSFKGENMVFISATEHIGTDILLQKIEEYVLKATNRKIMVMKVKTYGEEYRWLLENTVVVNETPDPANNDYMLVNVIITDISLARFKHIFIKDYYRTRNQ